MKKPLAAKKQELWESDDSHYESEQLSPEVSSFIYQQIAEFEPFVTPDTLISVVAKDPRKLAPKLEAEGRPMSLKDLRKMYRIAIVLQENQAEITEEALAPDIFTAIREAKEKLVVRLTKIQDEVISNSDRQSEINEAFQNRKLH